MDRTRLAPPRYEWMWLLAGIVLALVWFAANRALPPAFRGECCDAAAYVSMAESTKVDQAVLAPVNPDVAVAPMGVVARIVGLVFADTGYRTIGYPAFLAVHRLALKITGLSSVLSWMTAAMMTQLLLHIVASWMFYRAIRRLGIALHPAALMLIVAHPALTSHAALPLSDSLATSLLMMGLALMTRVSVWTGVVFAVAVWVRPAHLLPVVGALAVWCAVAPFLGKKLRWQAALIPAAALMIFGVVLSPRIWSCSTANRQLCFMPPAEKGVQQALLFDLALKSARTYTVVVTKPLETAIIRSVPDPFLMSSFGRCPVSEGRPTRDLLVCLGRNWMRLPEFFFVKAIGLFDNFHWNTYATHVTPPWIMTLNRAFGVTGFVGFMILVGIAGGMLIKRQRGLALLLVFPLLSWGVLSLVAIESRYGLLFAPYGMAGAVLLAQGVLSTRKRRVLLLAAGILALLFLLQAYQWDRIDPFPWIPLEQAL